LAGAETRFSYSVERRPTEPDGKSVDAAVKWDQPAVSSLFQSTPCRCQRQPAKITSIISINRGDGFAQIRATGPESRSCSCAFRRTAHGPCAAEGATTPTF